MKKIFNLSMFVILLVSFGCQNDWQLPDEWREPTDKVAPSRVISATVKRTFPGGAVIEFVKPTTNVDGSALNDLLGIKAVYDKDETKKGISVFSTSDSIVLEGFNDYPDVKPHTVTLYAVDKSQNQSEGYPVENVVPELNAINSIIQSLKTYDAMGGFKVVYENPLGADVALEISSYDKAASTATETRWERINTYIFRKDKSYSAIEKMNFVRDSLVALFTVDAVTGDTTWTKYETGERAGEQMYDTIFKQQYVRFRFMDRFGNFSGSLDTFLTPLPEKELSPYDDFGNQIWFPYESENGEQGCAIFGDMGNSTSFTRIFKSNEQSGDEVWEACLFAQQSVWGDNCQYFPMYITIDLGVKVQVTTIQFRMRQRLGSGEGLGCSRYNVDWDVWGSLTPLSLNDFKKADAPTEYDTLACLKYWTSWNTVGGRQIHLPDDPENEFYDPTKDGWTKDGTWKKLHSADRLYSILPSGYKYHSEHGWPLSTEDTEFISSNYFTFSMDEPMDMQYIRFRIWDTSSKTNQNEWERLILKGMYVRD